MNKDEVLISRKLFLTLPEIRIKVSLSVIALKGIEYWRPEEAAMGNSTLPTVLDKLCMVANINSRKLIEVIKAEITIKDTKIQALQKMIDSLEDKIKDQDQVLTTLEEKLPKK